MKYQITALVLALASVSAFAQSRTYYSETFGEPVFSTTSSVTRAQVRAELGDRIASTDRTPYSETLGEPMSSAASGATRAQVRSEFLAGFSGADRTRYSETIGEPMFSTSSSVTRAQVRAELKERLASLDFQTRSSEPRGGR